MKQFRVLGLDLGTNSIGWALVQQDLDNKKGEILGMGSRIIPMGAELSKFEQGQAQTKNANRRIARGMRRLNKRYKQRRNKLIYVLQQLQMLPEQIKLSEPFSNPLKIDRVCILPIDKKQKQYSALDILELRVRALNEKISLQEFGKIIYLFNQLRGYSGDSNETENGAEKDDAREEEEKKGIERYVAFVKVIEVSEPEMIIYKNRQIKKVTAKIETEDGIVEGESVLEILKPDESLELEVNIRKSKYGETITFKLPSKTSWRKKMENLEKNIATLSKEKGREIYLSEYFLNILQENNWAKIRNNVILRSRYQSEFDAIWSAQYELNPQFKKLIDTTDLLNQCVSFIFPDRPKDKPETDESKNSKREKYRTEALKFGFQHLVRNQIIYYQRELKDQAHLISDCRFEKGEKVTAKSHPIFQEYKIWEQINKLTINTKVEKGLNRKGEMKFAYEDRPIPAQLKEWLYDELQQKKEIGFGPILSKLKKEYGLRDGVDFLNGINPKSKLMGNETKLLLKKAIGANLWQELNLEKIPIQVQLWDILYHGKGNEYDLESDRTSKVLVFLNEYAKDLINIEQTAVHISKIKFTRNYGSLSIKAIEKILPLARAGKYFNSVFSAELNEKIIRLLNEAVKDPFEKSVQEFLEKNQTEVLTSGGVMNAYATILTYNRHTAKEYNVEEQIITYDEIKRLQPGELRNPLVEQLISETLIVVRDIWKQFGFKPDEIRLELARELKNNAERRSKIYTSNRENQKINEEVKTLLIELRQDITLANIEKYKLWRSQENLQEEYVKLYKDPSNSEIEKMRLWKGQGHVSPYTGQPVPLSELFNRERYDVDHIIPQSRYFDDSFSNKVICEKSVNKDKGNKTAMEYFETGSRLPSIFSKTDFINHVNKYFDGTKRKNLLATQIPEDPITRQIKETQYISVRVKEELNKIVGNENVKTTTGSVTDYLRNQWGLTDKFKKILLKRYEKVQPLIAEVEFEKYEAGFEKRKKENEKNKIPFTELKIDKEHFIESFNRNFIQYKNNKLVIKGWSKRVDHRHHAMDALVIACTEPKHIKRLNDLNKELQKWLDTHRKEILPNFEGTPSELLDEILALERDKRETIFKQIEKFKSIDMPWPGFSQMAEKEMQRVIVSQKPKDKLLIQESKKGTLQIKIRGQLHEAKLYGIKNGVETKRIKLSDLFNKEKSATLKELNKIINPFLKEEIIKHYSSFNEINTEAFSAEGILALNNKLQEKERIINWKRKGKAKKIGEKAAHTPISSIKVFYRDPTKIKSKKNENEPEEALQRLDRKKAFNKSLYVKTGDNYLFAILEKNGKRVFDLITFFDAANLLKEEFNKSMDKKILNKECVFKDYFEEKNNAKLLFTLKQGDSVYLPYRGEELIIDRSNPLYKEFWSDKEKRSRGVHYVTKYSGSEIYFLKHVIANPIVKKKEFGSQDAYQKKGDLSIKEHCIKLYIDRIGNITPLM